MDRRSVLLALGSVVSFRNAPVEAGGGSVNQPDDEYVVPPGHSHSFDGDGPRVTPEFQLADGITVVDFEHDGERNFIVEMLALDGASYDDELLVNQIGSVDGRMVVSPTAGEYQIDVDADGTWEIEVDQPGVTEEELEIPPLTTEGTAADFVGPVELDGVTEIEGTHDGESNFIVEVHTLEGGFLGWDLLFNEIGSFDGATTTRTEGIAWITIEADGDWTLGVS